jgi:hypothetical protein
MIDRYTIKFAPAVSQKELEKALHTSEGDLDLKELHKMKARIGVIGDFEDLKTLTELITQMEKQRPS